MRDERKALRDEGAEEDSSVGSSVQVDTETPPPDPSDAPDSRRAYGQSRSATEAGVPIISAPPPPPSSARSRLRGLARLPGVRLLVYYVLLIGIAALLIEWVPIVRQALISPTVPAVLSEGASLLTGAEAAPAPSTALLSLAGTYRRIFTTLLIILAALSLVIPVAWVYMYSKRLRYDPALVRSVIVLPIVVAGITVVVNNSIALAFALAGIVAAVRFRNTLKDPRDAVYIFLTIAIGLAAGVQALDIALVMSIAFNIVILLLWKYNVGSIYGGRYGRTGILSVGVSALLLAQTPEQQREIRRRLLRRAEKMKTDGILLVHSENPERARHTVQEAFSEMAKDWRLADIARRDDGLSTLEYLVRLRKKATPAELVGALDERWSSQVDAAEYIPFRTRNRERK